jgi:hypothetical protein
MAHTPVSRNIPKNPDPQEKPVLGNGITTFQGQLHLPEKPPKSLLDWLVRVHVRLIALEQEKHKGSR